MTPRLAPVPTPTHCPYCSLQCGITLRAGDRPVTLAPQPDFPTNLGGLCSKGWDATALLDHDDRLRRLLVRSVPGDRSSAFRETTMDVALDVVAEGISRTQARYGVDGVGVFGGGGLTNEKAYALGKFARVALRTAMIDYNGRFCMSSAATAAKQAFGIDRGLPFPLPDVAHAQAILLVGSNPAATMPPAMQFLEAGRAAGARHVVVDPRATPTAKEATLHLQPLPGTDLALANGLLHIAIREGHIDEAYVEQRTTGFDAVRAAVATYWPDRVERITGVPVADQRTTVEWLAAAPSAMVLTARGAEQHRAGTDTAQAFVNLALALGLPGRPASGYGTITGQGNGQGGSEHGQKADQLPGYRRLADPADRAHVASVWGVDPAELPQPGLSAFEMLDRMGADGGVRALLVFASNIVVSAPDVNRVADRLRALDLLVVSDIFLSETAQFADVVLPTAQWAEEEGTMTNNGISLRSGVRVTRVDRFAKVVIADNGTTTPYDVLILATGSRPFMPKMEGMYLPGSRGAESGLLPGIFAFRTLDDTRGMIEYARRDEHTQAVVVGGGLLGLEAARGLQSYGLSVRVVHSAQHLMNAQMGEAGGDVLQRSLERLGFTMHTGTHTTSVWGPDKVRGVGLKDGTEIPCDLVVVAAGIRPNTDVAVTSGFTVERAVVVDDVMRTAEDDDVFAVGECAQHRGQVYGLVAPLWEQAVVLADHLTGANPDSRYLGSRTATKLKVAGVDVASMGVTGPERDTDEHIVYSEPGKGTFKSVVIRDDKVIGATLIGDTRKVAFLQQAFDRGLPLPETRAELLFDLGGPPADVSVAELDDDAQICNCNGVSKRAICDAVGGGVKTLGGVMDKTRAGKGCGSCKPLVAQVVEHAAGGAVEEDPSARWYVPGVPMDKPSLMAEVRRSELRSVSAVFAALAPEGAEDAKSKMGLASLLKMMWGADYVDEEDARFINDRVHANIQKDGTFSVVPQMRGGVTTPEQLRRIADVAEKYDVPMVKLTGGQRIDLLGIRKEDLPSVWEDLGMPSGYAYGKSFRTVKTCVGQEFCRFGTGDSTKLGIEIETRLQGMESPAKMKLAVSGCPRNCAESYVKDVGIVAIEGGRWEIYVGGAAGAHIRKGDLLCTVDDAEMAKTITGRFLQYYRENAKWLERTYAFVPRVGLDHLRTVVVEDSQGIAERLDAAVQEHVDSHVDPWTESRNPLEPGQFRTSLPLEVLPNVPKDRAAELLGGSW